MCGDGSALSEEATLVVVGGGGVDGKGRLSEARLVVGSAAAESEAGGKRRLSTTAA